MGQGGIIITKSCGANYLINLNYNNLTVNAWNEFMELEQHNTDAYGCDKSIGGIKKDMAKFAAAAAADADARLPADARQQPASQKTLTHRRAVGAKGREVVKPGRIWKNKDALSNFLSWLNVLRF